MSGDIPRFPYAFEVCMGQFHLSIYKMRARFYVNFFLSEVEAIQQVLLGKCIEGEGKDKLAVIYALRGGYIVVATKPELSRQCRRDIRTEG